MRKGSILKRRKAQTKIFHPNSNPLHLLRRRRLRPHNLCRLNRQHTLQMHDGHVLERSQPEDAFVFSPEGGGFGAVQFADGGCAEEAGEVDGSVRGGSVGGGVAAVGWWTAA